MNLEFETFFQAIVSQLPGYEVRPQQLEMAAHIRETVADGGQLLVEAGTGSGKSFGYLLPAIHAGKTVVISTGTIQLQEQLIEKDLPFLLTASGHNRSVALAKGRSNYLCRQKLWEADRAIPSGDLLRAEVDRLIAEADAWDGDLASLGFAPSQRFWGEVASTSDDCLGNKCEFFERNPFRLARARLGRADIIIANHALYMVDLATGGGILPDHDLVIFDEAHHLPRIATQAFTASVGRYALTKLLQKIRRRWQAPPERIAYALVEAESRLVDWIWKHGRSQFRLYPDAEFLDIAETYLERLGELREWMENDHLDEMIFPDAEVKSKAPLHRPRLATQITNLIARWEFFAHHADVTGSERVNWVEVNRETGYFELLSAPLDVSQPLSQLLWSQRTAVLTSATLSIGGDFSYFRGQLGLSRDTRQLALASPFDYARQARLYLPALPEPASAAFEGASHEAIRDILTASQGRAFVLFTSYKAMGAAWAALATRLPFPCKQQGEWPRNKLLAWFKETPQAVLFATSSFWEGVDVPGDALSCVIIDRLPFAVPDDPVVQAFVERLKMQGRDWFRDYTLPEAILKLQQGFGRLIRTATDQGAVAILDARLQTKSYGRTILRALPPCPRLNSSEALHDFFASLPVPQQPDPYAPVLGQAPVSHDAGPHQE
ncbi:MAG: helicase C-terminal domain-containing protein [Candidatus Sericytochromatia bacterium]|nr:helicase C-terminal domain-containing protein [Candidatus Sericytochromatia bacterium]